MVHALETAKIGYGVRCGNLKADPSLRVSVVQGERYRPEEMSENKRDLSRTGLGTRETTSSPDMARVLTTQHMKMGTHDTSGSTMAIVLLLLQCVHHVWYLEYFRELRKQLEDDGVEMHSFSAGLTSAEPEPINDG